MRHAMSDWQASRKTLQWSFLSLPKIVGAGGYLDRQKPLDIDVRMAGGRDTQASLQATHAPCSKSADSCRLPLRAECGLLLCGRKDKLLPVVGRLDARVHLYKDIMPRPTIRILS